MLEKIIKWIRRLFRLYEKEIKEFVDDMLDLAFQNVDEVIQNKLTPEIRDKVKNKVLADILVMGIDIGSVKGKSEAGKIILDAIDWFVKEGEK